MPMEGSVTVKVANELIWRVPGTDTVRRDTRLLFSGVELMLDVNLKIGEHQPDIMRRSNV